MVTQNAIGLTAAGVVTYSGTGTFSASTFAQYSFLVGGASNSITGLGPATNGQILIGSSGVSPVLATLTAGTGVTIVNGAGSITISATGSPSTFPYTYVTAATQTLAANSGYFAGAVSGGTVFTLPASSAVGDFISIDGISTASGWSVVYGSGQYIQYNQNVSTVTTGSIASTMPSNSVGLVCSVANTGWVVEYGNGNVTIL
jgi:hypothetical protein